MFDNFSGRVTDSLVHNQIINIEDRDIYCYGVQQGLVAVLNFATTLLIGCMYGMPWESIIYMICYIPLRHYAGGFHAKTPARCFVFSTFMLFSVLSAMKWVRINGPICIITTLSMLVLIYLISPVQDKNKPLDNDEQCTYRKRARIIAGSEAVAVLALVFADKLYCACCIMWCLNVMAIMMLMGSWKNRLLKIKINSIDRKGKTT